DPACRRVPVVAVGTRTAEVEPAVPIVAAITADLEAAIGATCTDSRTVGPEVDGSCRRVGARHTEQQVVVEVRVPAGRKSAMLRGEARSGDRGGRICPAAEGTAPEG